MNTFYISPGGRFHAEETAIAQKDLDAMLVGRKIVSVDQESKTMTLDNGTVLIVMPHEAECDHDGDWFLTHLESFNHVITRAEVKELDYDSDAPENRRESYELFVYAEGIPLADGKVVKVNGDAGNGYYAVGFTLAVKQS